MTHSNSEELRDELFGGKTLKENLRDIVARNNTGYDYEQLKDEIKNGDDLLEDDEIEQVDKTVNLLAHLFSAHLKQAELHGRRAELESLPPYMFDAFPSVKERLEELKSMKGEI